MRFPAIVIGLLLTQIASGAQAQPSGTQAQNTTCPFPVLLSNDDIQMYIKSYSQQFLNELAAGKQFSDQPRTITVKELLGPIYVFIADHGWPKDITRAVSKLMSGPEEDIMACFPRLELVRRNLQENFDRRRGREAAQPNQDHKQDQAAVVNAADCRAAMESGMTAGTRQIFERNVLPQILSQKVQNLGQEVAKSLETEPVTAEDIGDPQSSRRRLTGKFGAIMNKRLEDLGDWITSGWYPNNPACFPALRPVLDRFELRAQTAAVTARIEKQKKADIAEKQEHQREEALAEQGYALTSIGDFLLDGKDLAAREAKVALQGTYTREGNLDVLYASRKDLMMSRYNRNTQLRVPLLADGASRSLRQTMLKCQSAGAALQEIGCEGLAIKGRATMCSIWNAFGVTHQEPCVYVEDSW